MHNSVDICSYFHKQQLKMQMKGVLVYRVSGLCAKLFAIFQKTITTLRIMFSFFYRTFGAKKNTRSCHCFKNFT